MYFVLSLLGNLYALFETDYFDNYYAGCAVLRETGVDFRNFLKYLYTSVSTSAGWCSLTSSSSLIILCRQGVIFAF